MKNTAFSRYLTHIFTLVTALSLSGCAVHYDVVAPTLPINELQKFTIGTAISDPRQIRSRWLATGSSLTGIASDKADSNATMDAFVGAVVGGVAGIPVPQSIALQGSLESSALARLPHSNEYGTIAAINVPEIFSSEIKEQTGTNHILAATPPRDGVHITPFSVLRRTKTNQIYASCGLNIENFAEGNKKFTYQYWMHSNDEVNINELEKLTQTRFKEGTKKCLKTLWELFEEHRQNRLNDKFESGALLYYDDFGWRSMYYKDNSRQAYLRYTPGFMEVYPFRVTFSYEPANKK